MSTQATKADALQRAFRTLWQGFGVDALMAVGAGLVVLLSGGLDVLSGAFWVALGVLILKSFLTALASYLQRLKSAPKPVETIESIVTVDTGTVAAYLAPEPIPVDPDTPLYYEVLDDHRP